MSEPNPAIISLSLTDRIFLGEGLFETLRFVNRKPCYARLHWHRLEQGAVRLGINLPISFDEWYERLNLFLEGQAIPDGGVKVFLTGGTASRGLTQRGHNPQFFFDVFTYLRTNKSLRLISAPWQRDVKNPIYSIKSMNYLEAVLGRRYAEANHADDILFFDTEHHALETSVANLFVLLKDTLHTPALNQGILPGVIRARLIALSAERGFEIKEGTVDQSMLSQANALFVCNSLQGIQRVHSWDKITYVPETSNKLQKLIERLLIDESTSR